MYSYTETYVFCIVERQSDGSAAGAMYSTIKKIVATIVTEIHSRSLLPSQPVNLSAAGHIQPDPGTRHS